MGKANTNGFGVLFDSYLPRLNFDCAHLKD